MSAPRYARLAGKVLAEREHVSAQPPAPEDRARAIAAVQHAIEHRARARRRARWIAGLAAAAAAVAVAGGIAHQVVRSRAVASTTAPAPISAVASAGEVHIVGHAVAGSASVASAGRLMPLIDGRPLATGDHVATGHGGRVLLAFSTGTSALVQEDAEVAVDALGASEQLRLDSGSIELHVAKQAPDERFVVRTPDAEVEVRGTRFRVSIVPADTSCGGGTVTRVAVFEGVVVVRHAGTEARLAAGEQWPGSCAVASESAASAPAAPPPASHTAPAASGGSTLSEQNDLFARAMAAKRRHDDATALAGFDRLLARYPRSPLAENAAVERMRLLRDTDPVRAARAARAYLATYPNGFARGEAQAIAAKSP